jgi:hypothetical protein
MIRLWPFVRAGGLRPLHAWFLLLAIVAYWWWRVLESPWYSPQPNFDALHTYLPMAKRFLLQPGAFLFDPERIAVAPGSYLYFALFGADPLLVLQGNLWLSTFTIVLLFDAVRRLGSWWGGLAAAALYVVSPVLLPIVIPHHSEVPYLFLMALWLWALIHLWTRPHGWSLVLVGAFAIAAATLTRAIHLYWIPAAVVGGVLGWWRSRTAGSTQSERYFLRLAVMHLLALVPLLGYVALNNHTHHTSKFVTGSGAALYFGMNAAVGGEEPPYFGLLHMERAAYVGDQGHLMPEPDKQLMAVGKAIAFDMPKWDFFQLLQRKIGSNLFFSYTHLGKKFTARFYRIVLVFFALLALVTHFREPIFQTLAVLLCYHLSVLSLLMYNQRYSVGSLELPLIVLAGVGIGTFFGRQLSWRMRSSAMAVLVIALLVGAWQLRSAPPPMPDLSKVPHVDIGTLQPDDANVQRAAGSLFAGGAQAMSGGVRVRWERVHYRAIAATPILRIPLIEGAPACRTLHLTYEIGSSDVRRQAVSLKRLTSPVELALGTLWIGSLTPQEGALTLDFECPEGTRLQLGQVRIQGITLGPHYLARVSGGR